MQRATSYSGVLPVTMYEYLNITLILASENRIIERLTDGRGNMLGANASA